MAKRTKTSARAGKVKRPAQKPEWKAVENKEEVEEDVDSDDGSFVDDDTEDFLPSGWTGKTKGRKENTAAQGLNQQFAIPKTKLTTSKNASDIAENTQRITPTLHQVTLKSTATRPDDLPSHLVDKSEEKPRNVISPTSQTQTANEPTEAETITVSRLEVRRRRFREDGFVFRQPGLRRCGDPLLSLLFRAGGRRNGFGLIRSAPRREASNQRPRDNFGWPAGPSQARRHGEPRADVHGSS